MKTYGFDYSFALSVAEVNAILEKNLSGISLGIQYTTRDPDTGSTITLNASLSPWQIVRGGQNTLLNFNIPIAEGFLSFEGGAIVESYDLEGVAVEMQVSLSWMGPGDQQQATGSGDLTKLTFNPSSTTQPDNPGYVAVVKVCDPNKNLDTVALGVLKAYFAEGIVANKKNLQYIFANVDPTPAKLQSWLNPVKWLYFYVETPQLNALSFLCMLTDAPFPQAAFDASTLDSGTNAILLISQPSFFNNVVLPGVRSSFPSGSFTMSCQNEYCTINSSGDFDVKTVTVTSFTLTVSDSGDGLKTISKGGGPLKFLFGLADLPGASYSWEVDTNNPLVYTNQQLVVANDPKPTITQDHTMPWYDWVLVVVLGITNAPGLVAMIYDLVNNFAEQIDNVGMSTITSNIQGAAGGTVVNLTTLIDWQKDGQTFDPTIAGLAGALYVRGNLA